MHTVVARADEALANLYPGYFAVVMATGILSTASWHEGYVLVSGALLWMAVMALAVLVPLLVLRAARHGRNVLRDLREPRVLFTHFTFVAALDVIAARLLLAEVGLGTAVVLATVAALAWIVLMYWSWSVLFLGSHRAILASVNGGWLVSVVATQSLAIVAARLSDFGRNWAPLLDDVGVLLWTVGVAWYGILIVFITMRLTSLPMAAADVQPPYWINMGATAISTVAGASLFSVLPHNPHVAAAGPLLFAGSLGLWAWGTFWIPLLVLMGVHKYVGRGEPFRYEPGLWSLVFPLGMYSFATASVADLTGIVALKAVSGAFLLVGLLAWLLVASGLLASLARGAAPR